MNKNLSTPPSSKVHCSINGLENSSSPEYSKVQHFSGSAVELFSIGVELFSVRVELEKSSTPIEKVLLRSKKVLLRSNKVLLQSKKVLLWPKLFFLKKKKICFTISQEILLWEKRNPFKKESGWKLLCRIHPPPASPPPLGDHTLPLLHQQHNLQGEGFV